MALTSTKSLGLGLIIASLLPLSHGSKQYSAQSKFISESSERRATVVGLTRGDPAAGDKNANNFYSIVEFVDDEGSRRTERTNVGSYPAAHSVGDEIDIRFHHRDKQDVRVDSFTGIWFESAFYLIPGIATLLGGIAMFRSGRNRHS